MTKCSIIVPVYNCQEEILRRCLDCFNESGNDIEVIVIDDGSTNEVSTILSEYASFNPSIHIITQENRGVSATRNRGIEESIGEYIVFCDADDMIDLSLLVKAISLADEKSADVVQTSYHKVTDTNDSIIDVMKSEGEDSLIQLLCEPNRYGTVWAKVMKREFLIKNDIRFNQSLTHGEDSIFLIDCMVNSPRVCSCDLPFYTYFVNLASAAKANHKAVGNYISMMRVGRDRIKMLDRDIKPYYSCFCNINLLILMVNYIFPKGSKYSDGREALMKVLDEDIIKESLASYSKRHVSLLNKLAFFCLRNKWYIMCYMMANYKNRNK